MTEENTFPVDAKIYVAGRKAYSEIHELRKTFQEYGIPPNAFVELIITSVEEYYEIISKMFLSEDKMKEVEKIEDLGKRREAIAEEISSTMSPFVIFVDSDFGKTLEHEGVSGNALATRLLRELGGEKTENIQIIDNSLEGARGIDDNMPKVDFNKGEGTADAALVAQIIKYFYQEEKLEI